MPLITIVGAGPGLGLEIARAFGRKGFDVALVARDQSKLDTLAKVLGGEGVRARGFTADVSRPETITSALAVIKRPSARSTSSSSHRRTRPWRRSTPSTSRWRISSRRSTSTSAALSLPSERCCPT